MAKKLVVVESPTKARTITKMLGEDYKIMASMGHIRDLPERALGVDVDHDFEPKYVSNPRSKKIISELKAAAKKADAIYLAPDPDREGEAIAWHLQELLKSSFKGDFQRVTFHEITKSAIGRAFEYSGQINMNLVDAQQARRVLDRVVGYKVSPLLWSHILRGTSAGRVQTVALRLVVEKEREIKGFTPEEYWTFKLILSSDEHNFEVRLIKVDDKKLDINNETDAVNLLEAVLAGNGFEVSAVEGKDRRRNTVPPFTTSTLQQAANNSLRMSASNTMRIAQQLYEGIDVGNGPLGLITYMRTDSVNISKEAQESCRGFITENYGNNYVPEKPNRFKSKAGAQEAHEAIRPTNVAVTPESIKQSLDHDQYRLYDLIWRRFVASQMTHAIQRQTVVDVATQGSDEKNYLFRANAMITTFPGYLKVLGEKQNDDAEKQNAILGSLKKGQNCELVEAEKQQKFTEPPARYSEATLIKMLEENGIGRPSTYATILRTIQTRNYVESEKGRLYPTELGFNVCDFLLKVLPNLFDVKFTSRMETLLDNIEEGQLAWVDMLKKFYDEFKVWVEEAKTLGAPDSNKVVALLELFEQVKEWAEPEKKGRRNYDDKKFITSIQEKHEKDGKISAKQWEALLRLAGKYSSQLAGLNELADKNGFGDELSEAFAKQRALEEKLANGPSEEDLKRLKEMLDTFSKVEWAEPTKRGRRVYDDKKFFTSFGKQVEQGKALSEKQIAVLGRFALKYREQLTDFDKFCELAGLDPAASEEQAAELSEELKSYLEQLSKVENWAEPTKKGRRVYDDKAFFVSIEQQAKAGKSLSPRQIAAIKRLVNKYYPSAE